MISLFFFVYSDAFFCSGTTVSATFFTGTFGEEIRLICFNAPGHRLGVVLWLSLGWSVDVLVVSTNGASRNRCLG